MSTSNKYKLFQTAVPKLTAKGLLKSCCSSPPRALDESAGATEPDALWQVLSCSCGGELRGTPEFLASNNLAATRPRPMASAVVASEAVASEEVSHDEVESDEMESNGVARQEWIAREEWW